MEAKISRDFLKEYIKQAFEILTTAIDKKNDAFLHPDKEHWSAYIDKAIIDNEWNEYILSSNLIVADIIALKKWFKSIQQLISASKNPNNDFGENKYSDCIRRLNNDSNVKRILEEL
ncbi:hypothetical protein [Pectinatus cerevisiiphilus]|nr:hypothetical protein [Pectinatus cerevisiiphilus]